MEDYPYDLGQYGFRISTPSAEAQIWFDRGLNWVYGYNHGEAIACFKQAVAADPACAMAHWGIAYATGPNYNMPWALYDEDGRAKALRGAYDATQEAMKHIARASPVEAALIRALPARYPQPTPQDGMEAWDHAFADAMRAAFADHPDHRDLRTVYVESLLNLTPWKMWDLASGRPADGAATLEAQTALEDALAEPDGMSHPGLLHLYIHLMEMSPTPEKALPASDRLRRLVPDAGHLVHMPTHIDVLCGHYQNVVDWNQQAVIADRIYFDRQGPFNIYSGYRLHNYHFVIYGAMFLGQFQPAMDAVREMATTIPDEMLEMESPPMADFFESYLAMEPHVLIRFGRWQDCINLPLPDQPELRSCLTAYTYYARALGHAALGDVAKAEAAEQEFLSAKARVSPRRRLHNNRVVDLLEVATHMLRGEIAYRAEAYDEAFAELRRAVHLEDTLPYDEPWGWMQPVRHALGALLFEQGHVTEAEAVYREDLGLGGQLSRATVHPDNVWALRGLYDCLKKRDEAVEITHIKQRLDLALARADRAVAASCFCAQAAMRAG